MHEERFPELLSPGQVARLLGVSYWRALRLIRRGTVPHVKSGDRYYVRRRELMAWLEGRLTNSRDVRGK